MKEGKRKLSLTQWKALRALREGPKSSATAKRRRANGLLPRTLRSLHRRKLAVLLTVPVIYMQGGVECFELEWQASITREGLKLFLEREHG